MTYITDSSEVLQKIQEEEGPEPTEDEDIESGTSGNAISRAFEKVLELPGVSLLKPSLSSLIPVLAGSIPIALAAVAIPAALFLVLLSSLFGGKKASSVVSSTTFFEIANSDSTQADTCTATAFTFYGLKL